MQPLTPAGPREGLGESSSKRRVSWGCVLPFKGLPCGLLSRRLFFEQHESSESVPLVMGFEGGIDFEGGLAMRRSCESTRSWLHS